MLFQLLAASSHSHLSKRRSRFQTPLTAAQSALSSAAAASGADLCCYCRWWLLLSVGVGGLGLGFEIGGSRFSDFGLELFGVGNGSARLILFILSIL